MRILQENPFIGAMVPAKTNLAKIDSRESWSKFADKLATAVDEVDCLEQDSKQLTQDAVLGRVENLHDVMIATEKAKTAMSLTLEMRGKVLEAYKEIMRMQF
ncbi:MAG: flagellar hook-basal body complex protein FliE [Candidatus Ozemobacteraceae bacterium]